MKTTPPPDLTRPIRYPTPQPAPSRGNHDQREAYDERAAIMQHEGGIPTTLAEWLAALQTMKRPEVIPQKQWEMFIADCSYRVSWFSDHYNGKRPFA